MKSFRRTTLVLMVMAMAASLCAGQSNTTPVPETSKLLAESELNAAVASYRQGKFEEAQRHCQNAVTLDPTNKTAPIFLARSTHAQYRRNVVSDENIAKAREAIAAYRQILVQATQNDEAYNAIAYLLGAIEDEEAQRAWILARASDTSVENKKRAEAYIVLASKDWDCAFKRTELPTSKEVELDDKNKMTVHYLMPKEAGTFDQAKQCASHGLNMADQAISLDPENESAWSYKANILLENAKLSEMAKDEHERVRFSDEYEVALTETKRLARTKQTQQASEERPGKKSMP